MRDIGALVEASGTGVEARDLSPRFNVCVREVKEVAALGEPFDEFRAQHLLERHRVLIVNFLLGFGAAEKGVYIFVVGRIEDFSQVFSKAMNPVL